MKVGLGHWLRVARATLRGGDSVDRAAALAREDRAAAEATDMQAAGFEFRKREATLFHRHPDWAAATADDAGRLAAADRPGRLEVRAKGGDWLGVTQARDLEALAVIYGSAGLAALGDPTLAASVHGMLAEARPWHPSGTWGTVDWKGAAAWSDSPNGHYANNANSSLTGNPFVVSLRHARLTFDEKHDLEKGYDYAYLEASEDGQSWAQLQTWTGSGSGRRDVDLSPYEGRRIQLRFRLQSDGSNTADGISFANATLSGIDPNAGHAVAIPLESFMRDAILDRVSDALRAPAPARSLEGLTWLSTAMGSAQTAAAMWPVLATVAARPDVADLRALLVSLAQHSGVSEAIAAFPSLAALDATSRAAATATLDAMATDLGSPTAALALWPILAPHHGNADFADRVAGLTDLAKTLGLDTALHCAPTLEQSGPPRFSDRAALCVAASQLAGAEGTPPLLDDTLATYAALAASAPDGATCTALRDATAEVRAWTADRPWQAMGNATWCDSPDGNYSNNLNASVTTAAFAVSDASPRLTFEARHELEKGYDWFRVEISEDGQSWKPVTALTGSGRNRHCKIALAPWRGKRIRARFRLTTDGSNTADGVTFGKVALVEGHPPVATPLEQALGSRVADTLRAVAADSATPAADRAARLRAIGDLARDLQSLHAATVLWPVLSKSPDLDAARQQIAELARSGGVTETLATWPSLAALPPADRAAAIQEIDKMAQAVGDKATALALWRDVAPARGQNDFEDRALALSSLSRLLGVAGARQVWPAIAAAGPGSLCDRVVLFEAALRLTHARTEGDPLLDDSLRAYAALAASQPEPALAPHLLELAKQAHAWDPEGKWALVQPKPGRWEWTDNPQGHYDNNVDASLRSRPFLLDLRGPRLCYDERHAYEKGHDGCNVEVSDDGRQWRRLAAYTGSGHGRAEVDLSAYEGKRIQVRFHEHSDGSNTDDGVRLANVTLEGVDPHSGRRVAAPFGEVVAGRTVATLLGAASDAAVPAALRTSSLAALRTMAADLGSVQAAALAWPGLAPYAGQPGLAERTAALVDLVKRGGSVALDAWPILGPMAAAERQACGTVLDRMAKELDSYPRALAAWIELAPHRNDPDFADRTVALMSLVQFAGDDEGRRLYQQLSDGATGTCLDRARLFEAARTVGGEAEGEALYRRLLDSGGDAAVGEKLRALAADTPLWHADAPWTAKRLSNGAVGWSDNPSGQYANNTNASLTTGWLSLAALKGTTLSVEAAYDFEKGYDHCYVEASRDGVRFQRVADFSGKARRGEHAVDLSAFDGQSVRLRFHVATDGSNTAAGITLGRLSICGGGGKLPLESLTRTYRDDLMGAATEAGQSPGARAANLEVLAALTPGQRRRLLEFVREQRAAGTIAGKTLGDLLGRLMASLAVSKEEDFERALRQMVAPDRPQGTIEVADEEVVIGGIRVHRNGE